MRSNRRSPGPIRDSVSGRCFPVSTRRRRPWCHALIKNHGFIDGNKRTAVIAVSVLLERSGYELNASNAEVEWMAIAVADSKLGLSALTDWFRVHIRRPS